MTTGLLNPEWIELNGEIVTCRKCPRLVEWREKIARERKRAYKDWDYWGRPITGFGDPAGQVLVVGLAPGAHGANRTGRIFTGDSSGRFLFRALYEAGFANQPDSISADDGLMLKDVYISAVCRCAPPGNKPSPGEIDHCLPFLEREIDLLQDCQVIVALGRIAFDTVLRLYRQKGYPMPAPVFSHSAVTRLGDNLPWLVVSFHPSQQNTQTGRLTEAMFADIWVKTKELLT